MNKREKRRMLYEVLRSGDACAPALEWAKGKTVEEALESCEKMRWLLWAMVHLAHNGYRHLTWDCIDMGVYYKLLRFLSAPLRDKSNPAMRKIRRAAIAEAITDHEVTVIEDLTTRRDCGEAANLVRILPYTLNYPGTLIKELNEYLPENQPEQERVTALLKKLVPMKVWKKILKDIYAVTPRR